MKGTAEPEFSRLVLLARIAAAPCRQEIRATAAECAALARRFDLVGLYRLDATVALDRRGTDLFMLRAVFTAEFAQNCVVTLDPVSGTVSEEFAVLYGPPAAEGQASGGVEDEIAFEPLSGNAIDIGEAVAQQFSLALPPFPRSPGASLEAEAPSADSGGSFAALSRLRGQRSEDPR